MTNPQNPAPTAAHPVSDRRVQDVSPATSVVKERGAIRHGKWSIFYDPPPIPTRSMDWGFAHDDFDASWGGEEDGYVHNGLAGRGESVEDCLAQIADMEAAQ